MMYDESTNPSNGWRAPEPMDEGRCCKVCGEYEAYHNGAVGVYSRLSIAYVAHYLKVFTAFLRYGRVQG